MIRSFICVGKVKGKQRPKVAVRGTYAHAYTPQQTVDYENYIKLCYLDKYADNPLLKGALTVSIQAYYKIPSSFSKQKRENALKGLIMPTVKPDIDNVIKVVCDALNSVAYTDDNQICSINCIKKYGEDEKLIINLAELENV